MIVKKIVISICLALSINCLCSNIQIQRSIFQSNQTIKDQEQIYEQDKITSTIPSLNDSEFAIFFNKHFNKSKTISRNGIITVDLIIEKNGTISSAIIVKGINPEIDRETIRVLKLLPKFVLGKLKGMSVRSKYRLPVYYSTKKTS